MTDHLPGEFILRMRTQLGGEADEFFHALSLPAPVSIRLHHLKGNMSFTNLRRVPWCKEGYYLESRPHFHLDPHWHGGAYYVQEASSMILDAVVPQLLSEKKPRIWLDVCAAPGGKTGLLAKHMSPQDVLIANEVVPQRRSILRENLYKAGYLNTFLLSTQPENFDKPIADIMLIDAPCAGEGMFRKEEEAVRQWSLKLVAECALLQQRILTEAARAVKPGGFLIYSTCSYSQAENMDNVVAFTKKHPVVSIKIEFPAEWNITAFEKNGCYGYQLYPHKVQGEGLFISVLQKQPDELAYPPGMKKQKTLFLPLTEAIKNEIRHASLLLLQKGTLPNAFITAEAEEKAMEVLMHLPSSEIIAEAGQWKGKDFIPAHFLSMSGLFPESTKTAELSLDESLDYLERNTQSLPSGSVTGWHLMSFMDTVIGWAKHTQQGWRNHYPLHWRLRSRRKT